MRRTIFLVAALALVAAACGDTAGDTTTTAPPTATLAPPTTQPPATTTTAAPTTTVPPTTTTAAPAHPGSSVTSQLTDSYVFGSEQGPATADDLPFDMAAITVHWYNGGDNVVAVYDGLDPAASEYLCPGNSILTAAGFEHVSNAAVPGADCSNAFSTIDSVPGVSGGQVCNGLVSYITAIPSNLDGELFGTIEVYPPDGRFVGATGTVIMAAADLPGIDPATLSC